MHLVVIVFIGVRVRPSLYVEFNSDEFNSTISLNQGEVYQSFIARENVYRKRVEERVDDNRILTLLRRRKGFLLECAY